MGVTAPRTLTRPSSSTSAMTASYARGQNALSEDAAISRTWTLRCRAGTGAGVDTSRVRRVSGTGAKVSGRYRTLTRDVQPWDVGPGGMRAEASRRSPKWPPLRSDFVGCAPWDRTQNAVN
jgi:hypothetical protein